MVWDKVEVDTYMKVLQHGCKIRAILRKMIDIYNIYNRKCYSRIVKKRELNRIRKSKVGQLSRKCVISS